MSKRICSNNRFIPRHTHPGHFAHHAACAINFAQIQGSFCTVKITSRLQRQCNLLDTGIPGSFPYAIDRSFELIDSVSDRGKCVRRSHPQIVVAVGAELNFLNSRHLFFNCSKHRTKLIRSSEPYSIRQVDHRCPG
ncbi:hypothetical protein D3C74_344180 [compost metagenome]